MNIQIITIMVVIIIGSIIAATTFFITLFQTAKQIRDKRIEIRGIQKTTSSLDTIPYPSPPISDDVVILRKEFFYDYLPNSITVYQRKRLRIQSSQSNLKFFKDRFRWTGKGECIIKPLTPYFKINNQYMDEEGIWNYFDVVFPHPLLKDEVADFTIEWQLNDEEKKALPFLSTMIDRETQYLLLQVNLPDELAPKHSYFYEFKSYIDTLPIRTEEITWSPATKALSYEVFQPVKYHKYSIRWYREE